MLKEIGHTCPLWNGAIYRQKVEIVCLMVIVDLT